MMPRASHPDNPSSESKRKKEKPLINVVPGTLQVARPKNGDTYAVQAPKDLNDHGVRASFAHLLMCSGVASGLTKSGDAVVVHIDGHRGVRLTAGQWLVVSTDGAAARDDAAFRAAFDVDPVVASAETDNDSDSSVAPPVDVSPSPVVTT